MGSPAFRVCMREGPGARRASAVEAGRAAPEAGGARVVLSAATFEGSHQQRDVVLGIETSEAIGDSGACLVWVFDHDGFERAAKAFEADSQVFASAFEQSVCVQQECCIVGQLVVLGFIAGVTGDAQGQTAAMLMGQESSLSIGRANDRCGCPARDSAQT